MGSIEEYILKIKIPTNNVKMEDIQELLKKFKALNGSVRQTEEFKRISSEVAEQLWLHLMNGFEEFDNQLLCSTCFYTVLTFSNNKEYYFNNILEQISDEIDSKMNRRNISVTISMMYGIFQSSIIIHELDNSNLAMILNRTFKLVTLLAYEYSQYTFIVFKIMTFFKKVICSNYQDVIFNEKCNLKLLNVINHNWENPINGIRNLNKVIFGNLITAIDEKMHEFILKRINNFYWNKAKYLMLSEIIEQHHSDITILISKCRLREGLIYSLNKPGLVSAGADMYISIVKKINTDEEWCTIFGDIILETFKSESIKPIENFINYWCLNTFKLFPTLVKFIFSKEETLNLTDHKLSTCLSLMQQSHRLGLLEKNFSSNQIEELVLSGIGHIDAKIRAISFDIICVSQKKYFNNQNIYNIILDFLKDNVNSDCSVLRISMINSLQKLLLHNHRTFVNNFGDKKEDIIDTSFLEFCTELQLFIIESLNYNGNYQRKITTVQILKTILKSFTELPRKKQKQPPLLKVTLINFLINRNNWLLLDKKFVTKLLSLLKDPSDDIREHVMYILLQNYSDQLCESNFMQYLSEDALTCIRSKFFYQISCGYTIFKLILNLLLIKRDTDGQFKKVEDIFDFAYEALKLECDTKTEIIKSIDEGKQLHSYLSILFNVFEVSLEKSYKLKISMFTLNSLLDMLESISNQFAWEEGGSSDFSKMSLMVHEIIANSTHQRSIEDNETNISGLHQIVLNCLWLNVKASCMLSSILIKYYKDDNNTDVCKKCLNIICHVLETSRHKGAIEAGGTALGQAIQTLTSLSEESTVSKIPMDLLKNKLNDLISETSNMASVTRRGAGLSIMVHRIVSSDMKKGKPLFHFFMRVLLETFKKLNNSEQNCTNTDTDGNSERDLPKAIYIHFLTKIVIDSSLASDVLFYSADLAEIVFGNLTDSCWQIRNAALQLYGSLIPKLIGQKKKSGENEEVMATVAVDEFRTHSPKLWKYIVEELKDTNRMKEEIQSHNNLVPILSVIANMAPKYDFDYTKEIDVLLLPSLISLLESPIYVVRRLTVKCLLNIYTVEVILNLLLNSMCETENCLHGTLMLLNDFIKQYNTTDDLNNNLEIIKCKYFNIMKVKHHSYLCKERFEHAFPSFLNVTKIMITETLLEITENKSKSQGLFLWANHRIKMCLEHAEWEIIPEIIALLMDCSDFEAYGAILYDRLQNDRSIPEELLSKLFNTLYSWGFKKQSTIIWKIMYKISLKIEIVNEQIEINNILHRYLKGNQISYRMRYILPLAARLFKEGENKEILTVSKHILKLCNHETSDADMRLVAAMANNELAKKYRNLLDDTKINIIIAAVMFLQDEDEDVRICSVHFYRVINECAKETHPYICLKYILTHDFLITLFGNNPALISSLHCRLSNMLQSLTVCIKDDYNPFINDSKNIYLEIEVIKQLLGRIKF